MSSDQAAADEPPATDSGLAAAAHHDTDSDARSANATIPNTAPAARADPSASDASDATDPATANLAAIADFDANRTADTGPTARVDADPAPSDTGADVESVVSGGPSATSDMAVDGLALSASSYSVRGVGESVISSSLSDGSLSSYSMRDALASATSWSFLSDSASDCSNRSRSDCSSPAGLLVATADSDPGSADTDADGGNDGHADADANANTGSASSDAHANTDARDTADAHIDAGADADTSSADSDAHADADANAGTGSGSADSDAANGGIDMDVPSAVPRAAEPSPAPPGWRAISLEDGVTMYRNLTSGALSLSARDDDVLDELKLTNTDKAGVSAAIVNEMEIV